MKDTKILTLVGASGSGKTTIAFKIAKELEKKEFNVCIVSFDKMSPLSTIKENYLKYNVSLGYLLTKDTNLIQRELYTGMIPLTENISLISYIYGDIKDRYPKVIESRVRDFIDLLKGLVDYIIVDGETDILNVETRTMLNMADRVVCILEPNYKSIAYLQTFKSHIERIDIDNEKVLYLINKIFYDTEYKKYVLDMGLKYVKELPYLEEIKLNENTPLKDLRKPMHLTEKYRRLLRDLVRTLYNVEYEDEEISQEIFVDIKEKEVKKAELKGYKEVEKKIDELKSRNEEQEKNKIVKEKEVKKEKRGIFNLFTKKEKEVKEEIPIASEMYLNDDY